MTRLPRYWTYLLLSERGETYAGYTSDLARRIAQHNSVKNRGWTRGRGWRLVAAECYFDRGSAVAVERRLKRSRWFRRSWLNRGALRIAWLCSVWAVQSPLSRCKS